MTFTVNTKALLEAVSLGIVNSNINRYDMRSMVVQISADEENLTILMESNMIRTEIDIIGNGVFDEDDDRQDKNIRIVDTVKFKQLVLSFDAEETILRFVDGGIELRCGKSKFVVPQVIDSDDTFIAPPNYPEDSDTSISFDKEDVDFIKNNQLFAIATKFKMPVYTYVYVDDRNNVIVGNMENALFTLSHKLNLGKTCLLSTKIINMFNAVPGGANLYAHEDEFILTYDGDGFKYIAEFKPKYENKSDVGEYNAEIFLGMMEKPDSKYCSFESAPVNKFLSQLMLLSKKDTDKVTFVITGNTMTLLSQEDSTSTFQIGGDCPDFELSLRLTSIRSLIANFPSEELCMCPAYNSNDELSGILMFNDDMVAILAGVE